MKRFLVATLVILLLLIYHIPIFPSNSSGNICRGKETTYTTEKLRYGVYDQDYKILNEQLISVNSIDGCGFYYTPLGHRTVLSQGDDDSFYLWNPDMYSRAFDLWIRYSWGELHFYKYSTVEDKFTNITLDKNEIAFSDYTLRKIQHSFLISSNNLLGHANRKISFNIYDMNRDTNVTFSFKPYSNSQQELNRISWKINYIHFDAPSENLYLLIDSNYREHGMQTTKQLVRYNIHNLEDTELVDTNTTRIYARNSISDDLILENEFGDLSSFNVETSQITFFLRNNNGSKIFEFYNFGETEYIYYENGSLIKMIDKKVINSEYIPSLLTMNENIRIILEYPPQPPVAQLLLISGISFIVIVLWIRRKRNL